MSFLFTFSLPKLPFRNPFSTSGSDDVASERSGLRADTLTFGEHIRSIGYRRSRLLDDEQPHQWDQQRRPVEQDWERNNESRYPVSRKRKTMMSSFGDDRQEEYEAFPALSHHRRRGREAGHNGAAYYAATEHDEHRKEDDSAYHSRHPPPRNDVGVGEEERPMKRRKMGFAESLISTAISVIIVSTAVGYTAYRMWRDGAFSSTPKVIQAGDDKKLEEEEEEARRASVYRTTRSNQSTSTTTFSPPPPYREDMIEEGDEEIDAWIRGMERTIRRRNGGEAVYEGQNQSVHPASLSLALPLSSTSPPRRRNGGGGRDGTLTLSPSSAYSGVGVTSQVHGHRRRIKGTGRLSSVRSGKSTTTTTTKRNDLDAGARGAGAAITSPVRRYLREETTGSSLFSSMKIQNQGEDGAEANEEEEEMLFDAQMSWMSDRLKGLIEDGQRALGRPIVLREENQSGLSEMEEETGWVSER